MPLPRLSLWLAPLLVMTGCATPSLEDFRSVSIPNASPSHDSVAIVDGRSEMQRASRSEPLGGSMAWYLGDDRISPAPVALLATRLGKHRAQVAKGGAITLKAFEVRLIDPGARPPDAERLGNTAAMYGPMGAAAAPLAGALIGAIDFGTRPLTTRCLIDIEWGDQSYRGIIYQQFRGRVTEADIAATVEAALNELDARISEAN